MTKVLSALETTPKLKKSEKDAIEFAAVEKIEKASKELPMFEARTTFLEYDYTKLVNSEWNRDPAPNPRLKADLEQFGQVNPVAVITDLVTGIHKIIDGKHRTHYLMELGLPIECIEMPESFFIKGTEFEAVKALNGKGVAWSKGANGNYMGVYLKTEEPNFVNFNRLVGHCPNISETDIYRFVNGTTGKLKDIYENGTLKFMPTEEQETRLILIDSLMDKIKKSRSVKKVKSYFDKPQIVKLLNDYLNSKEDYEVNLIEAALLRNGYKLNRESDTEQLTEIYQEFNA